jgi:TP901-1 family phage major tail protein
MKQQVRQGIDVILYINDKAVAGQQNISLNRSASAIDITNQINGDWQERLSGLKTWSIACSGLYIINSKSYDLLEEAFMNNADIEVEVRINNKKYKGNAIITNFPVSAGYNGQFKYNMQLLGNGELNII